MKFFNNLLFFISMVSLAPYAYADIAPLPEHFWRGECGFESEDYDECISQCEQIDLANQTALFVPRFNAYYMVSGDYFYVILPEDIESITQKCRYLERFGKALPLSLKILRQAIDIFVSKREQNCSLVRPENKENCDKCSNTELSSFCFLVSFKARCMQICLEAKQCRENYINRNVFW